jgi:hypothetical protein
MRVSSCTGRRGGVKERSGCCSAVKEITDNRIQNWAVQLLHDDGLYYRE